MIRRLRAAFLALTFVVAVPAAARAQERYAVIVSGATGAPSYAQQYTAWTRTLMILIVAVIVLTSVAVLPGTSVTTSVTT